VSCGVELAKLNIIQLDPYCQWSFNETQWDHSLLFPVKSSNQATDIDPFATVLFLDVRLFEMRYLAARLAFQLAWLLFLGLHIPGLSQWMLHQTGIISRVLVIWQHNHVLIQFFPHCQIRKLWWQNVLLMWWQEKEYGNSFSIFVKEWGKSAVDCLVIVADALKSLRSWWNQEDIEGSDVLLIRRLDGKRSLEGWGWAY